MTSRATLYRKPTDRDKLYVLYAEKHITPEILAHPDLFPHDKLIYGVVAQFIDTHGRTVFDDDLELIKKSFDIHPRRVDQSVIRLARLGLLIVQVRDGARTIWTDKAWIKEHV